MTEEAAFPGPRDKNAKLNLHKFVIRHVTRTPRGKSGRAKGPVVSTFPPHLSLLVTNMERKEVMSKIEMVYTLALDKIKKIRKRYLNIFSHFSVQWNLGIESIPYCKTLLLEATQ